MTPEFTRPFRLGALPPEGTTREVAATPAECAALARRLGIPAVTALSARFALRPVPGGTIHAEGALTARIVQVCVVSLEEFESPVTAHFTVTFVPAGRESEDDDPEAPDELPFAGDVIDLGEAAAEELALALDPYPRRPGAALPEQAPPDTPFAALAARRTRN